MLRRSTPASTQANKESADARSDDALAADDLVADPARRPLPRRHRDRFAQRRGTDPPLHLPRRPRPRAAARQRAGAGSASRRASASARWPGTAIATSSSTTPCPASGAVIHTINPRLFPDQLTYIVNHAEDRLVFFDLTFLPLVEKLAPACPGVTTWVAMTDRAHMPASSLKLLCYEELLAAESDDFDWPEFDENTAAGLCYTSGTTGNPKGVLFSHRSTVLHAYGRLPAGRQRLFGAKRRSCRSCRCSTSTPGAFPTRRRWSARSSCFPARAWTARACTSCSRAKASNRSAGVPTVWLGLIEYMKQNNLKFSTFKQTTIGGSACPPAMIRTLARRLRRQRRCTAGA